MRENFIKAVVAAIALVVLFSYASCAKAATAENAIRACVSDAHLKAAARSAVVGGTVLGFGALVAVATSPVSVPVSAGTAIVASNVVVGGLVGASSSIVTRISDSAYFSKNYNDPVVMACLEKVGSEKFKDWKKDVEKNFENLLKF